MNQDPSYTSGNTNRLAKLVAPLVASVALYGCSMPTGPRPELVEDQPEITQEDQLAVKGPIECDPIIDACTPAELHDNYFESPERNLEIQEQVGELTSIAAELSTDSDRFETVAYENKLGQEQIDMFGENAQGDQMRISVLGTPDTTPNVFSTEEGDISIQPDSIFISVVPHYADDNFYNFDSDVSFRLNGSQYETTLRVDTDKNKAEAGDKGKYYRVLDGIVGVTTIDHQNPSSIKGGSAPDADTARAVDELAFQRAKQLLLSVDNDGPVGSYFYSDGVASLLQDLYPDKYSEIDQPVSQDDTTTVAGTVPKPTVINGTTVVPTTTVQQDVHSTELPVVD